MANDRISPADPDREIRKWDTDWEGWKEAWPVLKWLLIFPAAATAVSICGIGFGWW